jgi:hypothetical protein
LSGWVISGELAVAGTLSLREARLDSLAKAPRRKELLPEGQAFLALDLVEGLVLSRIARQGARMPVRLHKMPGRTQFLNVDLDLYSRSDLVPLVDAIGRRVIVLHVGRVGRSYRARLEVSRRTTTADSTIREFCRLIGKLPVPARRLWDGADRRSFSIGVQAGAQPHASDFVVKAETVAAVAELGGEIVVTVYS